MLLPQAGCYSSFLSNDVEEIKNMGMKIKRGKSIFFIHLKKTLLIFLKAKMTKSKWTQITRETINNYYYLKNQTTSTKICKDHS